MKKSLTTLTFTALALAATLIPGLMSASSASGKSELDPSYKSISTLPTAGFAAAQDPTTFASTGIVMPKTPIYALNVDNTILVLAPGATSFVRLVRVANASVDGNLIGIDFRPADGNNNSLYAVTDTGKIYTINLTANGLGAATLVSSLTTRFPSGYQSLADFNPVVNALRLIGSDRLNYAVVNSGGNLNAMAVQTSLTYDPNDVNKAVFPHISAGTYNNNVVGAKVTLFYGIDYDTDSLVTIQPATPGGSSATGGGVCQTLGRLVTPTGVPVNISSTADIDIYTLNNGVNNLVGVSGRTFFTIDLSQVNTVVAAGTTQNVVTRGIVVDTGGGSIVDIAAALTSYEAENATIGGGGKVDTNIPGFSGTGFVNYADNVANSFVEFAVNQAGQQTLMFRYGNGSAANRTCNVTINGTSVGTVAFPPTGSFGTYKTVTLPVNLGTGSGFKAVRVTSTTAAGGPNLDKMDVQ